MSNRSDRRAPAHMAGRNTRRKEPLRDNYTYEQPSKNDRFEDVDSYSSGRAHKNDFKDLERQNRKKMSKGKKAAIIIGSVFLVLAALGAAAYFYVAGYLLKDLTVEPITKNKEELGINSAVQAQADSSIKNIALFGLDSRDDTFEGRSDCIIILSVDNKHGKIKMTSVLRDSNVSMRMTDYNGDYYYTDDKITHAYYFGGPELAVNTLNRNFSLNIEDYVTVNFIRMAEIIDACGGVKIDISYDEMEQINNNLGLQINESNDADVDYSDYLYEDGEVLLNGNQAVAYARIRYLDSDNVRASRQQKVLMALLEQARGKSKLEYPELIRTLMPMCKTSLEFDDIISLIPILLTDFTIETKSVPGEDENPGSGINSQGGWVWLYDLETAAKNINAFIYETEDPEVHLDDYVYSVSSGVSSGSYSSTDYIPSTYEDEPEPVAPQPTPPPTSSGVDVPDDPTSSTVYPTDDPNNSDSSEWGGGDGYDEPVSSAPEGNGGGDDTPIEEDPGDGGANITPDPPVEETPGEGDEDYDYYDQPVG